MYGLFYHVNVPLMRGHLVNAKIFWFSVPATADSNRYFCDLFSKYFISKMVADKQRNV